MVEVHAGPRRTSRLYDIHGLTEGEMDLIIGLLGSVNGDPVHSPVKYAKRLLPRLTRATGYKASETDSRSLAVTGYRTVWFSSYNAPGVLPADLADEATQPAIVVVQPPESLFDLEAGLPLKKHRSFLAWLSRRS